MKKTTMKTVKACKTPVIFPRACRLLKDLGEEGFCRICECLNAKE